MRIEVDIDNPLGSPGDGGRGDSFYPVQAVDDLVFDNPVDARIRNVGRDSVHYDGNHGSVEFE